MNRYILDTKFFIIARGYYPDTFPSFWEKLSEAVNQKIVSSVSEVKKEIENYGGQQQHLLDWMNRHQSIFGRPSKAEQVEVSEIMTHFPSSLPEEKQLNNNHWADPFIIAKARHLKATVVTGEQSAKDKKGEVYSIVKIPDICDELEIRWISPQEFLKEQKWRF